MVPGGIFQGFPRDPSEQAPLEATPKLYTGHLLRCRPGEKTDTFAQADRSLAGYLASLLRQKMLADGAPGEDLAGGDGRGGRTRT